MSPLIPIDGSSTSSGIDSFAFTIFDDIVLDVSAAAPPSTPPPTSIKRPHDSDDIAPLEPNPSKRPRISSACRRPSSLRFHPVPITLSYVAHRDDLSDEERDAVWWAPDDYESFRESAKVIGRKLRDRKGFTNVLERSFDFAGRRRAQQQQHQAQSRPASERAQQPCHQQAPQKVAAVDQQDPEETRALLARGLTKWSAHGHACRGLEKYGCVNQLRKRTEEARGAVRAVLEEQNWQREQSALSNLDFDGGLDLGLEFESELGGKDGATANALRKASTRATHRARTFARMLGNADAAAVLSSSAVKM